MTVASHSLGGWLRRRVIVTGGASGFGEATVRWMVNRGANVIIADINEERGTNVAKELSEGKPEGSARFIKTDVTKAGSWTSLVKTTLEELGGLDVLVNNAGGSYTNKPSLKVNEADFDKCINLNVRSVFHSVGAVVPHFLSQKQGAIVNGASSIGVMRVFDYLVLILDCLANNGSVELSGDSASWRIDMAAVSIATKSLAVEYATSGIRINAVCPVAARTPLLPTFLGKNPEAAFMATVPMGRLAQPEEVASAISWLASDEAKFVTGVCLEVDGGRCV